MQPLVVERVRSSFFEDESLFPPGAVELDSALVMRDIPATWRARNDWIDGQGNDCECGNQSESAATDGRASA